MTRRRRAFKALAAGVGLCGLLWLAAGAVLCESVLRVRKGRPAAVPFGPDVAAVWHPVKITARDGAVLSAWLLSPASARGDSVILLHGITDSRSGVMNLARLFLEQHYSVLAPDNRGHGESGGDIVTYGLREADDLHRWIDWLAASEHPVNIYALGESLGAAVLLETLPSEHRLSAVVAECPFASFGRVGVYRIAQRLPLPLPIGEAVSRPIVSAGFIYARSRYGLDFRQVSPEDVMEKIDTPVLLIHGLDDIKTPAAESQILAARNPRSTELWLVPGARHVGAFEAAPDEFKTRVLRWFSQHRNAKPRASASSLTAGLQ